MANKTIHNGLRLVAVAAFIFAGAAAAQTTQTSSTTASADVMGTITLTKKTDLSFGGFAKTGTAAATIVMTPAGSRSSASAEVTLGATVGTAATYDVTTSAASITYTITLPTTAVTLTGPSGSTAMTVTNFTITSTGSTATGTAGQYTRQTSASNADSFGVGATLNVGATQAAGRYAGTFNVTAAL